MEINVNVKIDLSENTLRLLSAMTGTTVTGPKETPVVKLEKSDKKTQTKTETATSTAADAATTESKENAGAEDMRLKIRTKVVSLRDAGKKDETVKLMTEYGITQLSKLPEDQLTEFLQKLNAIK